MLNIMAKHPNAPQTIKELLIHTTGVIAGARVNWGEQDLGSATLGYIAGWGLAELGAKILTNEGFDPNLSLVMTSITVGFVAIGLMLYNKPQETNLQLNHQHRP